MMKERFLPIGSIVLLNGGTKELMITGYCIVSEDALKDKSNNPGNVRIYDYSACTYPEGFVRTDLNILFDEKKFRFVTFSNESNNDIFSTFSEMILLSSFLSVLITLFR